MGSLLLNDSQNAADRYEQRGLDELRRAIERAAHLLPAQGPITAFVHHNTLHALEHLPFEEAVIKGGETFGCHPFLPEHRYYEEYLRGRIRREDLEAVLIDDLGDRGDELLGFLGTRFHLRLGMLAHRWRTGPTAELRWVVAETNALRRFRDETPRPVRDRLVGATRRWVMRD
ncbi:MAG TPA: putative inorganic carbon transporter subunit DabA, partial [Lacipirellulaceae bacterium]|nr:putative inorganic carbon transporter subunit DabA [Lacipirellulaceae bacterium]